MKGNILEENGAEIPRCISRCEKGIYSALGNNLGMIVNDSRFYFQVLDIGEVA